MQPQSTSERELPVAPLGLHKARYDYVVKTGTVKRAPGVRRITVGTLYRPAKKASRPTPVPFIRLSGKWLERAGFTTGNGVEIRVAQGEINLRVAK